MKTVIIYRRDWRTQTDRPVEHRLRRKGKRTQCGIKLADLTHEGGQWVEVAIIRECRLCA